MLGSGRRGASGWCGICCVLGASAAGSSSVLLTRMAIVCSAHMETTCKQQQDMALAGQLHVFCACHVPATKWRLLHHADITREDVQLHALGNTCHWHMPMSVLHMPKQDPLLLACCDRTCPCWDLPAVLYIRSYLPYGSTITCPEPLTCTHRQYSSSCFLLRGLLRALPKL